MAEKQMSLPQLVVYVGDVIIKQVMNFNTLVELDSAEALAMAHKLQLEGDEIFCYMIRAEPVFRLFNEKMQQIILLLREDSCVPN